MKLKVLFDYSNDVKLVIKKSDDFYNLLAKGLMKISRIGKY